MRKIISILLAALMLSSAFCVLANAEGEFPAPVDGAVVAIDGDEILFDGTVTAAQLATQFDAPVTVRNGDTVLADNDKIAAKNVVSANGAEKTLRNFGDVNGDGKVNVSDVTALLKKIANWDVDAPLLPSDVDANGKISLTDVTALLKKLAGWDDIALGGLRLCYKNEKLPAENEASDLSYYFASSMLKVARSDTENKTGYDAYKLKLAKNEYESCQLYLVSGADCEGLSVEVSDFVNDFGDVMPSEVKWEFYTHFSVLTQIYPWDATKFVADYWPEALPQMTDTFELAKNCSQGLFITAHSAADTPAGLYRATVSIKNADGKVIKNAYVYADVWDFALPDTPYSASAFNLGSGCMARNVPEKSGMTNQECYNAYYEFMLEHNLSDYTLPYNLDTEEGLAYARDPRVTAFAISGMQEAYGGFMYRSDDYIKRAWDIVKNDPEIFAKGYFYYTDEPWGEGLQNVKTRYEHLETLLGIQSKREIRNMTPLGGNDTYADAECQAKGIDAIAYIEPYISLWCPQSLAYLREGEKNNNNASFSWTRSIKKYGDNIDRFAAFKADGDELWWYICCSPQAPYPNFFFWYQGAAVRMVLWQQFMFDIDGLLYYATCHGWGNITRHKFVIDDGGNGDGLLLYAGEMFGGYGPVASWRLPQIRDGFDDFDYLRIAEQKVGRDKVMKVVNTITTGVLKYSEDYRDMEAARDAVAKLIVDEK